MAKPRSKPTRTSTAADTSAAVDEFMAKLEHPNKPAVEALRKIIRAADPAIAEGVKWNAPSFRTSEYFATTHLRAKQGIAVILHLGAKARPDAKVEIEDADGMLQWLATDRAMLTFSGIDDLKKRRAALQRIVRQWIAFV